MKLQKYKIVMLSWIIALVVCTTCYGDSGFGPESKDTSGSGDSSGFGGYDDICENGRHNCSDYAICNNTLKGIECSCMTGYTGDGFNCTDLNECFAVHKCHIDAECLNTLGSYRCPCKPGYTGDGFSCTDIDECFNNKCHHDAVCSNTLGSYQCSCKSGYTGDGLSCSYIVDACKLSNCDKCGFTATGFYCYCYEGFTSRYSLHISGNDKYVFQDRAYNNSNCSPIPYNCSYDSISHKCNCTMSRSQFNNPCLTIAPCTAGTHNCHENATCVPIVNVTHTCRCNDGFTGNGFNCTDVDECDSLQSPCTKCQNTIGGYSCGCVDGYDGDKCTDVDECAKDTHDCHLKAKCTNTDGSYYCTCEDQYYMEGDNGTWCSGCPNDSWTRWIDSDFGNGYWHTGDGSNNEYYSYAYGIGDFEFIAKIREKFPDLKFCENPTNIEVRRMDGSPYYEGGNTVHITVDGFYCLHSEQHDWNCHNYYVRFCCPDPESSQPTTAPKSTDTTAEQLSNMFDASFSEIVSQYECKASSIGVRWIKSHIGLGYLYKLQIQDLINKETKETSVQIALNEESDIKIYSTSDACVTTSYLSTSNKDIRVEVIVGKFDKKIQIISKVIYDFGKKKQAFTFVDLL